MRPPFTQADADMAQITAMIDTYMEKGFTYFDTSYVYGSGISENVARKAIVERYPRDRFQLAIKLPM
jgi:Predicted oxidoreductases of the aldo/keto reductase family